MDVMDAITTTKTAVLLEIHNGQPHVMTTFTSAWAIVMLTMLVIGALLNGINFFALLLYRKHWSCGHILMATLCGLDLSLAVVFHPSVVHSIVRGSVGPWSNHVFCQTFSFVYTYQIFCSTLSCVRIAVFRVFQANNRQTKKGSERKRKRVKLTLLIFTYGLAAFLAVLPVFRVGRVRGYEAFPPFRYCGETPLPNDGSYWIRVVILVCWIFLPSVVMFVCYVRVYWVLRQRLTYCLRSCPVVRVKRTDRRCSSTAVLNMRQRRSVHRLSRLGQRMVWAVVVHSATHYPVAIAHLTIGDHSLSWAFTANLLSFSLLAFTVVSNAVIYGLLDPQMIQPYANMFRCRQKQKR